MRVKLLVGLSGPAITLNAGDAYDCDDAEAKRLFTAGFAVPWADAPIERAVAAPAPEMRDPLDHDGDGRKGGSLKKTARARK